MSATVAVTLSFDFDYYREYDIQRPQTCFGYSPPQKELFEFESLPCVVLKQLQQVVKNSDDRYYSRLDEVSKDTTAVVFKTKFRFRKRKDAEIFSETVSKIRFDVFVDVSASVSEKPMTNAQILEDYRYQLKTFDDEPTSLFETLKNTPRAQNANFFRSEVDRISKFSPNASASSITFTGWRISMRLAPLRK